MARKNDGKKGQTRIGQPIKVVNEQKIAKTSLTKLEKQARREAAQSIRMASCAGLFGSMGGSGYGGMGGNSGILSADSNFYSPQLSTDFLELPQSEREKRELFRFWYTCLIPGAPVVTWDGTTIPIEDIRVGDKVPNGFGSLTEVVETFRQDIKDNIVRMRVRGIQSDIQATGNHPFYALRSEKVDCKYPSSTWACRHGNNSLCQRTKCEGQDFGTPEYIYAKDLKIGDYVISPWLGNTKDCGLNRAELRLLGYYASEGSLAYRSAGAIRGVEFSLSIDEAKTIAIEISSLYEEAFKKKARIYTDSSRNTTKVVCDGIGFARFCEKYVGRGSHEKRLHEDLVHADPEQILEFLGSYWNGDGCFTDNSYTADTMSEDLASQVFHMLRRLQIPAYNAKYDRAERIMGDKIFPAGTVHYISFPGRYFDVFSKYANWVNGKYSADSTRVYIIYTKEGFLHRIESLEAISYEGPVFNFEVNGEGDQKSYIAYSLATHNTHPIVGAAIDFHCFPPGAPVMLKDGSVTPIESLNSGDEVLNGLGEPTKILRTFQHDIHGPVTRLKVRGIQGDIDCTENHPFLTYRAEQVDCKYPQYGVGACKHGTKFICGQKKCLGIDVGEPEFVFAHNLKVGDYICSPSMIGARSTFNRSQLRLLGYYAAEGSLSRTAYGKLDRVVFSLNIDEFDTIANEISELFSIEYKHQARKHVRTDHNACEVRCYKKDFAEFCYKYVGSGSRSKKLSIDITDSPREDILEFLGAYWNGDGSLTKNGYVATTASKQLAYQIYALALKVGYAPTLHANKPKVANTGFKSRGIIYRIMVPYRFHHEFSRYANFVQDGYRANTTREYCVQIRNNTLRRIEKVSTVQYDGSVHNIEVDGVDNRKSYIAYGLATHNTDVPMSKIHLSLPKGSDNKRNKQILHFYEQMGKRIRLFQVLYDATHEYWLHGNCFLFCEDHDMTHEIPEELIADIKQEEIGEIDYAGRPVKRTEIIKDDKPIEEAFKNIKKHVQEHYQGWQRVQILPPEQVKLEVFQYTNRTTMQLIPSEKDRLVVLRAQQQDDPEADRIAEDIPEQIKENLLNGQPIPLNTSPYDDFLCSSFCYHLAHKKSAYDDRGISILERCLRTLIYQDKLRQAQTSIASRAMTPKRVVWADKMSEVDVEDLRNQVDQALIDPDFTIITNFEVHWDEIGARDRLLDLATEYDITNKLLYIGLRITESMLTGESTYAGERIHLDVMNTMYLLYRETVATLVEENLFAPVAEKKGFYEIDEFGNKNLLYPKLKFTRLALRDNSELQDFMFNLYQKGSLPISYIYELINVDPHDASAELRRDLFTPRDSTYNELVRALLTAVGDKLGADSNIAKKIADDLGLELKEEGDRFGAE
jgi:intein/homing endonuclease